MTIAIKICGLNDEEAVDAAVAAGADMIGLVYFPPSPRHVQIERAAELAGRARGRVGIVVLTVDAGDELLGDLNDAVRPDIFQLHGRETPERTAAVQRLTGVPVMKAIGVADTADLARIGLYEPHADRILLDAKPPVDAALPGGNGRAFDWSLLAALDPARPFMLSGGIDAANAGEAIRMARPAGIDVSSGVESAPGTKDPQKVAEFVRAVREAAAGLDLRQRVTS